MEGASGHNDHTSIRGVEAPRPGVERTNQTFPTPRRAADKSDTVLHAVVIHGLDDDVIRINLSFIA